MPKRKRNRKSAEETWSCPKCGSKMSVYFGTGLEKPIGHFRRYRRCENCGHHTTTIEVYLEHFQKYLERRKRLDKMIIRRQKALEENE